MLTISRARQCVYDSLSKHHYSDVFCTMSSEEYTFVHNIARDLDVNVDPESIVYLIASGHDINNLLQKSPNKYIILWS